jgi:hypothetical protein
MSSCTTRGDFRAAVGPRGDWDDNPDDMGFSAFLASVDVVVMGSRRVKAHIEQFAMPLVGTIPASLAP